MEEISVNGENYVKASVLAKNFGYTPDYIGQLCRSGQVKCTLVGRSWYVNEDSLREHRKGRYRSSFAKSKEHIRKAVEDKSVSYTHTKATSPVKYENDEEDLFPVVKKAEEQPVRTTDDTTTVNLAINKPLVVESVSASLKDTVTVSSLERRPTPVFRTIPALRPIVSPIKPTLSNKRPARESVPSRISPIGTFALFACLLLLESALLFGVLGLEKRLVFVDHSPAMVLYGFDAEKVVDSVKETLKK